LLTIVESIAFMLMLMNPSTMVGLEPVIPEPLSLSSGGYTRRSSTAKKANTPMQMRRTATAITGVCIPSLFSPAIGANVPPQR
jgi:hypothetical protein